MAYCITTKAFPCLAVALLFSLQTAFSGEITCERLGSSMCAFAVSSSGHRCVLEKRVRRGGLEELYCRQSDIPSDKQKGYIETNECMKACGLDRFTVGISSDFLLEPHFMQKLCSPQCSQDCPNVWDLYFNLAAGEGVFLPKVCEGRESNAGHGKTGLRNSGTATAVLNPAAAPCESEFCMDALNQAAAPCQSEYCMDAFNPAAAPF